MWKGLATKSEVHIRKENKIIHRVIIGEIAPGQSATIQRKDQPPVRYWQTSPVEKIVSMAIMNGKLVVKFETYNTVYTVVQHLNT